MLKFDKAWRFASPGNIPDGVVHAFYEFIARIAGQNENQKYLFEHFKRKFSLAAGRSYNSSSNLDWAQGDLRTAMWDAATNAALFIEAFYDALTELERANPDMGLPDVSHINKVLYDNEVQYEIQPPNLISRIPHSPIPVQATAPSFAHQAQERIFNSLSEMDRFLAEGRDRPAVQEGLWLLESVVHAFQGLETEHGAIQGDYFNTIVKDMSRQHKGQALDHAIRGMTQLHGFLSSPTGGGVRHGADLRSDLTMSQQDARLYCNLIRSYISYLLAEHERMASIN